MVSLETPVCEFDLPAIDFSLPGVDGKEWTLQDCRGDKGLLIMFICNHCPYVIAVRERIIRDVNELKAMGINCVAINSNDSVNYPDDNFDSMIKTAEKYSYPFPYLFDESQQVAKAYGAVCTPDFFGYNSDMALQYRGRLDESRKEAAGPDVARDLFDAMQQVVQTGHGPKEQIPSMGCSIKWRGDQD